VIFQGLDNDSPTPDSSTNIKWDTDTLPQSLPDKPDNSWSGPQLTRTAELNDKTSSNPSVRIYVIIFV